MASAVLRANCHKRMMLLVLGILVLFVQKGGAYEFKFGGSGDWSIPSGPDAATSYNQWAQRSRFQIGDTLLFNYPADKDSVLQVNKEDFNDCNTASPIAKHSDGHSVFTFNHSGPHYFISGVEDNCKKNEKVVIVVMADRSNRSSSNSPPSPAPGGEESPSPPSEMNPTPSPSEENPPPPPPPPSGASSIVLSIVLSFVGSIGAFVGSSLLVF